MTVAEGILGLLASVVAIIAGMAIAVRWLDKRFEKWTNAVIDNSQAMRSLTARVLKLELALLHRDDNGNVP